ncbi:hypothetical protein GH714_034329 [Hevea brasiliensis]|uniref:RHOMBOID-like protein n=1 Tax=Hevea brasiliensis TaxID=3981 RepID=A0A6A6NDZ0_HEVBR|nr:hypothetical protein GH714_034329 [Hevea brasiliensis]
MGKRPPSSDIETGSCVKHPPLPPFTPTPPEQWCSWLLPLIFEVNITMFIYAMLERFGALDPIAIVKDGEEWPFFSCIWLHAGVAYLATYMISLLLIEIPLEQEFGFLKIGTLFVFSGFGGSLMSALSPKPIYQLVLLVHFLDFWIPRFPSSS